MKLFSGMKAVCGLALLIGFGWALPAAAQLAVTQVSELTSGPYGLGAGLDNEVLITVTFNETITSVTPSNQPEGRYPRIRLALSPSAGYAYFATQTGANTLRFRYRVRPGDFARDMNTAALSGFETGEATITHTSGTTGPWAELDLPAEGTGNSLRENGNIDIDTIFFTSPPQTSIQEFNTAEWLVTRDSTGVGEPVSSSLSMNFIAPSPPSGDNVNYPSTVTFGAGEREQTIGVTGLEQGGPFEFRLRPSGYPSDGSGDLVVSNVEVTSGPPPTFSFTTPDAPIREGDPPLIDTHTCTVTLSRPAVSNVSITVTSADPTLLRIIGTGVLTFDVGQDTRTFMVEGLDGPAVVELNGTASHTYVQSSPGEVTVVNVAPVIENADVIQDMGERSVGVPIQFSMTARDVSADMAPTPLTAIWNFGDGTTTNVSTDADGFSIVEHAYLSPGVRAISVTVQDKDGGSASATLYTVDIQPGTELLARILGRRTPPLAYNGFFAGLGEGRIDVLSPADFGTNVTGPHSTIYLFTSVQPSAQVQAVPEPVDVVVDPIAGITNTFDSFFHVWRGEGFIDPAATAYPLRADDNQFVALAGEDRVITAVFSREYMPGDGWGDMDQDGLPDQWEEVYWPGQLRFENPTTNFNEDEDFLPRDTDEEMGYDPADRPVNFTPDGIGFGDIFELRGQPGLEGILNDPDHVPQYPVDARDFFGTDPTVPDTDGDGMSDGWEYYFWWNAHFNGIEGERYDPAQIIASALVITAAEIEAAFHPLVAGGGDSDLDEDGLADIEEYALGTNPIHWDTDGDRMADGWEILRGLNPFADDSAGNADGDYMAALGYTIEVNRIPPDAPTPPVLGNVHYNVYASLGYDPRTGWAGGYRGRNREGQIAPNTTYMYNIDEYAIMRFWIDEGRVAAILPDAWEDFSTNPFSADTDGDGAPDGWETYVYFDPNLNQAGLAWDIDFDGLLLPGEFGGVDMANGEAGGAVTRTVDPDTGEVTFSEPVPLVNVNDRWWNKFWPTDPNNADTDGDFLGDGTEQGNFGVGPFLYDPPAEWNANYIRGSRAGGGLNPTSIDTDMDFIPDYWEVQYRYDRIVFVLPNGSEQLVPGMDGTIFDSKSGQTELTGEEENYDYDGDGLDNYQEYWANAVYHFNYDKWGPGQGPGGYDPADMFTGIPFPWDWATAANRWELPPPAEGFPPPFHVQYRYIEPEPRPLTLLYASTDPSMWDSDFNGLDDHYEMYYGLNPLWSEQRDIISKFPPARIADIRVQPWTAGESMADPDQDGIPNWEEGIFPDRPEPVNLNSDPAPYWVTDYSYEESWVNLYYGPGSNPWYFPPPMEGHPTEPYPAILPLSGLPPSYVYSFANDEGYDTDNDNLPDKVEATGSGDRGATDPVDFDSPRLRKALYLDGRSAARTRGSAAHELNQLRSWTVEVWVRPEQPQSPTGERQIIIERPVQMWETDPMPAPELIRRTFRLGLEPNGRPFAEYNNSGSDLQSETIHATGWVLEPDRWYHLAAVMDGLNQEFSIYVNGVLVGRRPSMLIPATGVIDGHPPLIIPAPIVVGAADRNPRGRVETTNPPFVTAPDLHMHFSGWVDEIRVWDGPRSQSDIGAAHMQRLTIEDVRATMVAYAEAMALLPDENPPDMPSYQIWETVPPVVVYHYTFDNLPDPTYDPIVPQGFELLNGRPNDGTYPGIPWWMQAPDRSRVYSDYQFVHWAQNTPSHVPAIPMLNRFGNVTNYLFGVVHASPYWTANAPEGTFDFRRRVDPSIQRYITGDSSLTQGGFRDARGLLPLWYAKADMDVPLWDTGEPGISDHSSNSDAIPDWWYVRHGHDPDGVSIADDDPDGDGLSNYWEYRLGSDPHNAYSLDPAGHISDADWDSDGDGLSNRDEVHTFETDPTLFDTDDDGYGDGAEVFFDQPSPADDYGIQTQVSNPLGARSPLIQRSYVASGLTDERALRAPFGDRFAFLIEAVGGLDVTITAPPDGSQSDQRFIDLSATIESEDPVQNVRIVVNEQVIAVLGAVEAFTRTIIIGAGANEIRVEAASISGATGSDTITVTGTFAPADIRVTQTWNVPGDLDTWLVDPQRRHMGWTGTGPGLPESVAERIPGAFLDIDDIPGTGPENITLEQGNAIDGEYEVWMNNFSHSGNPQSTVMVLVHEGTPEQQFRRFGPRAMPTPDFNGTNPDAWWHTTTVTWPSGEMNPPGEPVEPPPDDDEDVETGFGGSRGWTLEAWIRPQTADQSGAVVAYRERRTNAMLFELGLEANEPYVRMLVSGGMVHEMRGGAIPADAWSHVAGVYSEDQKSLRLFVNGYFVGARQVLQTRDQRTGNLEIDTFARDDDQAFFSDTFIDEIRIWERARNGGLIRANMHRHVGTPSTLVAYYPFDDGGRGIEDFAFPLDRRYALGGWPLPDLMTDAKPGPDGMWGTADDIPAGPGPDGHNDYVTHTQYAPVFGDVDSDDDGIPDWWETLFFGGPADAEADADTDEDGLTNLTEYRVGTNPLDQDTDADGVLDGYQDFSRNGLVNRLEQEHGTDPRLWDTDNNGLSDFEKVEAGMDPLDPLVPLVNRVLQLDGSPDSYVRMAAETRFALEDWTVEAWVNPASHGDAELVARQVGSGRFNYYLGLQADGRPMVGFHVSGSTNMIAHAPAELNPVPLDTWTHVRGGFIAATRTLYLEIDGARHERVLTSGHIPDWSGQGPHETRVGRGFDGLIADVRIWSDEPPAYAQPSLVHMKAGTSDILRYNYSAAAFPLRGTEPGLVSYLRFDDGVIAPFTPGYEAWAWNVVQDFAHAAGQQQWLNHWLSSARMAGAAQVVAAPEGTPSDLMFLVDRNADGLPDWWQRRYWPAFDPSSSASGSWSPLADHDGDGLWNMTEYLAGLNPTLVVTDGSTVPDGLRDSDGDGLNNLFEQNVTGTRADLVDTDDDDLSDWEEAMGSRLPAGWQPFDAVPVAGGEWPETSPLNSASPARQRSAYFDGTGRIVFNHQARHALRSWTVQAWVRPDAGIAPNTDGVILRRQLTNTVHQGWAVNYELGVQSDASGDLRPYAQILGFAANGTPLTVRIDGSQSGEVTDGAFSIESGEWSHVAATYSDASGTLRLYIDGELQSSRTGVTLPGGLGLEAGSPYRSELTLGGGLLTGGVVQDGFRGYIDDVMLLVGAAAPESIYAMASGTDTLSASLNGSAYTAGPVPPQSTPVEALTKPHVEGEVLVRFKNDVTAMDVKKFHSERLGLNVLNQFRLVPVHHMSVADGKSLEEKLTELRADESVLYAEPNYRLQLLRAPNDPMYDQLWAMNNTGQTGGTPGAHISAEEAWERQTGSRTIRIAIIDTGINYNHPDLADNMWEGRGYDFADDDDDPMDDYMHGTHCAGTVGAVGNNSIGVAGVAWEIELMAVRVMGAQGGTAANIVRGIEYSVENGAHLSNNSYGGYGFSQAMYDAIQAAGNAGHLFVAAAGNDDNNNDGGTPAYPASYDLPNIIAVAASDHNDARAGFSNYGATSVDLAAPGVNILSTVLGSSYDQASGTSMASPHVAGAAAVIMAANPGMSYTQIRDLIFNNVDVLEQWNGLVATGGRLNLANSLGTPEDPGDPEDPDDPGVPRVPVLYVTFNDAGETVEDRTMSGDWNRDWWHAGETNAGVTFSTAMFANQYRDSNGDGIPDWWYIEHGLDPEGESVANENWDGTGISNYWQFRLGADPNDPYSLWKRWVAEGGDRNDSSMFRNDAEWDSDGEGLTNHEEIHIHLTDPTLPDTDDDGLTDKEEVDRGLNPRDALMPYVMRYIRNESGDGRIEVDGRVRGKDPDGARFDLDEWTLEATVRLDQLPSETGEPVILVSRRAEPYNNLTFELGIGLNNRAYVRYHSADASKIEYRLESVEVLPAGVWVSLAGRLSRGVQEDRQQLDLFVDSYRNARDLTNADNARGVQSGPLVMADGLHGDIDEVRIWNVARNDSEIDHLRRRKLHFGEDIAIMGAMNVNGGMLRRNYTADVRLNTWTAEAWFRPVQPGVIVQRRAGVGDDGEDIFNYRISINDEGYIEAIFSFNAFVNVRPTDMLPFFEWRWGTITLLASSRLVLDDEWHFASFSFDGRSAVLYLDGIAEDSVTIDAVNSLPALGRPVWHMLDGEPNPPTGYWPIPARMGLPEGGFTVGDGVFGLIDEVRVFDVGSTDAEIADRRFRKVLPTAENLVVYYDFDDLPSIDADEVMDKASPDVGTGVLLQGATLEAGAGVNAPIDFSPVPILAPKLAAYFPMDDGTFNRPDLPHLDRGFVGRQVKDFTRRLDFDFAGTFVPDMDAIFFMYNEPRYVVHYLANTEDWLADTHFIVDSDGDGMADWWEVYYGLDPNRVETPEQAELGPYGDPDRDGLSNLAEFLARTDPFDQDTMRSGFGDYDSRPTAFAPTFGWTFDDGDRIADGWEARFMYKAPGTLNRGLDPLYYDAHLDPDEDGWSNIVEFQAATDPLDPTSIPMPRVRFSLRYHGWHGAAIQDLLDAEIPVHLHIFDTPAMDGDPVATHIMEEAIIEIRELDAGHLVEGRNHILAFADVDGDGVWSPETEPAGISAFDLGWGDWTQIEIGLTDDRQMRGFPRFSWEPVDDPVIDGYGIVATQGERGELFTRIIRGRQRSYLHEGDFRLEGMHGVGGDGSPVSITFMVLRNNSVLGLDFDTPLDLAIAIVTNTVTQTPSILTGHDTVFNHARNDLVWSMDQNATWYAIEIQGSNADGQRVANTLLQTPRLGAPFRDHDGNYRADLPFYAGDRRPDGGVWANGRYWLRVATGMELGEQRVSDWRPFNLHVTEPEQTDGTSMIEGKLYYFGGHDYFSNQPRADGEVANDMPMIVQSFSNPGFSGVPDAQVTIAPSDWANTAYRMEATFQLKGLHRGTHYIRAFVDANRNGQLDYWESWGYGRDMQTYYEPVRISMESPGVKRVSDQMIIIRDRDTDGDGLPDIWEYDYYQRSGGIAPAGVAGFLDMIGGEDIGPNNLTMRARWQYGLDALSPVAFVDQNNNGIPDEWELYYFGRRLAPGEHVLDMDGDGMHVFDEYRAGTDPMNAGDSLRIDRMIFGHGAPSMVWSGEKNYRVQVTDSLGPAPASWVRDDNLSNYTRTALGGGAYTWTYADPLPPVGGVRYYRVVIVDDTDPWPPVE